MSDKTAIEWAESTWNPIRGQDARHTCARISRGCDHSPKDVVVAGHELARTPPSVVLGKGRAAPTSARDIGVRLAGRSVRTFRPTFDIPMVRDRGHDLKVLRSIVGLVMVQVMNLLPRNQSAADLLLGYQAVLINVAARVGQMMPTHLQENVPIRGDRSATLPEVVVGAESVVIHSYIVAGRVQ